MKKWRRCAKGQTATSTMRPLMGNSHSQDKSCPAFLSLQAEHFESLEKKKCHPPLSGEKAIELPQLERPEGKRGILNQTNMDLLPFSCSFSSRQPTHLSMVRGTNRAAFAATRNIPEATRYAACFRHSFPFLLAFPSLPFLFFLSFFVFLVNHHHTPPHSLVVEVVCVGELSAWDQTSQTLPSYVPIIPVFQDTKHEGGNFSNSPPLVTLIIIVIVVIFGIHCLTGQGIQARIEGSRFPNVCVGERKREQKCCLDRLMSMMGYGTHNTNPTS
ncbi:hypothetical protein B9Z19DRAFT_40380 [Tuber borchii]|uniref:Transmembrane protein n=1 Tax=Tuber borchii TaxID=42251 RepID=A0A2T6ZT86_TUBBO|nr:hypothetical protein B9Z19DRAFT_40380 [Tuber borchii]